MGITVSTNTKAKATLKLYNQLTSYLFEKDCGELKDAQEVLSMIISKAK